MAETIDLDQLLHLTKAPILQESGHLFMEEPSQNICIAVARDAAFNFYYEENRLCYVRKGRHYNFSHRLLMSLYQQKQMAYILVGAFLRNLQSHLRPIQSLKTLFVKPLPKVFQH